VPTPPRVRIIPMPVIVALLAGDLDYKLYRGESLGYFEREQAANILHSVRISPEWWNYLVIFRLSAAAIAADPWLSA